MTLNFASLLIQTLTYCAKLRANRLHLMKIDCISGCMQLLGVAVETPGQEKMVIDILNLTHELLESYDISLDVIFFFCLYVFGKSCNTVCIFFQKNGFFLRRPRK